MLQYQDLNLKLIALRGKITKREDLYEEEKICIHDICSNGFNIYI